MILSVDHMGSLSEILNLPFKLDDGPINYCQFINEKISTTDDEHWMAFVGKKGSGKSILAQKFAYTICPEKLTKKQIVFDVKGYSQAVFTSYRQAIVLDEAISIFYSRDGMSKQGKDSLKFSNKVRFKNLAHLLCLPKISDLSDSIKEDLNCIVHTWSSNIIRNGKIIIYKGNFRLYPKLKHHSYVADYYEWWERCKHDKKEYPLPKSWGPAHTGSPFHVDKQSTWTAVPENEYRGMKEDDLKTFRDSFSRKRRNEHPDYTEMDKLIRNGRSTVLQIAAYCNVCRDIVLARRIILGMKLVGHRPKKATNSHLRLKVVKE